MPILAGKLSRYFGLRFLSAVALVFVGIFLLVGLLDYIELMRRSSDIPNVSAILVAKTSLFRVPQVTERILPFCVLIGAMWCYLDLSRRLELVIARSAGMSAWQFIAPALVIAFLIGILATVAYNPLAAIMREQSKRYEAELFGNSPAQLLSSGGPYWTSQRTAEGQAIINATSSGDQGISLSGVTAFTFEQARESFATPETVPFWKLPAYIQIAEHAGLVAAGYRLQFQKLLARPFLLTAMVFLAAAVSLRFFRFGGVQNMVLSGVAAGFLLYVLSKVTEDLSKAGLMHPVAAAWLPVLVGGLTGFIALLYQEDG
jgi:lipopolysaccharide export system permease protein